MNNFVKEYLSFTRKERTGVMVLLALIAATIAFPYFLPAPPVQLQPDKAAPEEDRRQMARAEVPKDSRNKRPAHARYEDQIEESLEEQAVLFEFDPNTLPVSGWRKLGVRERTANTIQHYLAKGGRFRKPEDLRKIYGLKEEEADRLVPYVRIQAPEVPVKSRPRAFTADSPAVAGYQKKSFDGRALVDINTADTAAFIALRGIGSKLARRIVHFREKLGGFHAVEQVGETYGLPDSTFQQLRELLQCPSPLLRTININTADVYLLQQHPYIRRPVANAIVQYREQHGVYGSVDQLLLINIITPEMLVKIRPYLAIE